MDEPLLFSRVRFREAIAGRDPRSDPLCFWGPALDNLKLSTCTATEILHKCHYQLETEVRATFDRALEVELFGVATQTDMMVRAHILSGSLHHGCHFEPPYETTLAGALEASPSFCVRS